MYTVVHIDRTVAPHVLTLHDSHMHEEPDTHFNLLVLKSQLGVQTDIPMSEMSTNDHYHTDTTTNQTPAFELITFLPVLLFATLIYAWKRKSDRE